MNINQIIDSYESWGMQALAVIAFIAMIVAVIAYYTSD